MSRILQRCINTECRSEFDLDERVYVCSRCGDLLEIHRADESGFEAAGLREVWRERRTSWEERDRSGGGGVREVLPVDDAVGVVWLGGGDRQIYEGWRGGE